MQEILVSLKISGAVIYFKRSLSPFGDLRKLQFQRKGNHISLVCYSFFCCFETGLRYLQADIELNLLPSTDASYHLRCASSRVSILLL